MVLFHKVGTKVLEKLQVAHARITVSYVDYWYVEIGGILQQAGKLGDFGNKSMHDGRDLDPKYSRFVRTDTDHAVAFAESFCWDCPYASVGSVLLIELLLVTLSLTPDP